VLFVPARTGTVGIVAEPSFGLGGNPVMAIRATTLTPEDVVVHQKAKGHRRAPVRSVRHVITSLHSLITLEGPIACDYIGYLLNGVLGDVSSVGVNPTTWSFALQNSKLQQPYSYAVTVADALGSLTYKGCKVADLTLTFQPGELAQYKAQLIGLPPTVGSVSVPAVSPELPLQGWNGTCLVGGSVVQATDASFQLSRSAIPKRTVTGNLAPWLHQLDDMSMRAQMHAVAQTDSLRQQYAAGQSTSFDMNHTFGTGVGARQLRIHCSTATFTKVTRTYSGKWVELDITADIDANQFDLGESGGWSPVKVTLKNQVTSGY
jgi:hypothetical protein